MVAEWSAWGNCSETCGGGTSSRRREVAQQPLHGGKACPILEEERACNTELCVSVDCVVAEWSTWGSCSKTCGEGTMLRRREVAQQPIHDGEACPVLEEEKACNTVVAEWSTWGSCSNVYPGLAMSRSREVAQQPMHNGKACPALEEEIVCNTGLCEGVVTSTNYPYNYPNDHNKTQTIRVGEGFIIWLKFPAFDVEWHFDCRYDHLVIEDGDGTTLMEKRCGTTLPSKVFSKSNIVKLHFTTDGSTTKSGWRVNWTARKPATFVFSSVAGAAEHLNVLGEFVEAGRHLGRPFYRQRDTEGTEDIFLFYDKGGWFVGDILGKSSGYPYTKQYTWLASNNTTGWEYWDGKKWNNDTSLTLEFTSLSPCKLVRVSGYGDVVRRQGSSLGDYRWEVGRWSSGRPLYKKVDGHTERFLSVSERSHYWIIHGTNYNGIPWIASGRGTNSPASTEAGASDREGVTRWRYLKWGYCWRNAREGDITVNCIEE